MTETGRSLDVGIIDFNPKRMSPGEARAHGIPGELVGHLGDWRQYPPTIAHHFPDGVLWFKPEQLWYFDTVMANEAQVRRLEKSDLLILSGSGLSAHGFQRGEVPEKYKLSLEKSQEVIRKYLGEAKWVLGICFGGQLAMHAIGGEVGRLPDNVTEAGFFEHELTVAGKRDEVFRTLPSKFYAPHLHNDFVARLPRIGSHVRVGHGEIMVIRSEILAVRRGYEGKAGLEKRGTKYIMASVVEFDNGARLYQIQPHPEMATLEKANFLVRMNPWVAGKDEMGENYYQRALLVPGRADFSVAEAIPNFVLSAQRQIEGRGMTFIKSAVAQNLSRYLLT